MSVPSPCGTPARAWPEKVPSSKTSYNLQSFNFVEGAQLFDLRQQWFPESAISPLEAKRGKRGRGTRMAPASSTSSSSKTSSDLTPSWRRTTCLLELLDSPVTRTSAFIGPPTAFRSHCALVRPWETGRWAIKAQRKTNLSSWTKAIITPDRRNCLQQDDDAQTDKIFVSVITVGFSEPLLLRRAVLTTRWQVFWSN